MSGTQLKIILAPAAANVFLRSTVTGRKEYQRLYIFLSFANLKNFLQKNCYLKSNKESQMDGNR